MTTTSYIKVYQTHQHAFIMDQWDPSKLRYGMLFQSKYNRLLELQQITIQLRSTVSQLHVWLQRRSCSCKLSEKYYTHILVVWSVCFSSDWLARTDPHTDLHQTTYALISYTNITMPSSRTFRITARRSTVLPKFKVLLYL